MFKHEYANQMIFEMLLTRIVRVVPKVARTLTLIAKILQSIANMNPPQNKENYMLESMLPLIESNIDQVKKYIDFIVSYKYVISCFLFFC